jgi:hypothetical protein
LFAENFSAREALDALSSRSLDDWTTFYEGATRLVDYLNHIGHNGLMLSVLADGSTIYPSRLLDPTPAYDTGVFFGTGQDPCRKDALELVLRLFDRERLQLIPMLQFSAPLPELEALVRQGGPDSVGIELVGADGLAWTRNNWPHRGLAPYYNPLHPRVQQAMLSVARELIDRYAQHPSLTGLGIELSGDGYALPIRNCRCPTPGRIDLPPGRRCSAARRGPCGWPGVLGGWRNSIGRWPTSWPRPHRRPNSTWRAPNCSPAAKCSRSCGQRCRGAFSSRNC